MDEKQIPQTEQVRPGTKENPKEWGLWETKRNFWWGTTDAPLTYDTEEIAAVAARILDARMCLPVGRTRPQRFLKEPLKRTQDLKPKRSVERAIELLENGGII